jgi:energy-coupling factor transporter ATP-binding protein EcfA2
MPSTFDSLDESFFSLGQDDSYYEELNKFGVELRNRILTALRDVAADLELFEKTLREPVMQESLLRFVTPNTVRGQFHRLALGGVRLSQYKFDYFTPKPEVIELSPVVLSFNVTPESNPPTNIHVLIGRNGVGKTYLLKHMTRALVDKKASLEQDGAFAPGETNVDAGLFANLVSVTFSAFDPFDALPEQRDRTAGIQYSYVGLKCSSDMGEGVGSPKSLDMLETEFVDSVRVCLMGARGGTRSARWRKAVEMLETDPIFKDAEVAALADKGSDEAFKKHAHYLFSKFSSGHKVVLLTITRLVETVTERTLVLLDEPEAHLHPPLLSAFVRALSDLLINRNGVAIIATHSPVVLQEVPKSCVWKLRRTGHIVNAERPEIETFGENVGILTREVFGLEVTHSGFHRLLQEAIEQKGVFELVVGQFGNQLGAEARAIVRALIAARDAGDKSQQDA